MDGMKEVTIRSTWEAVTIVEVPEDTDLESMRLEDWPQDVLEEVTTLGASLTDWEVS